MWNVEDLLNATYSTAATDVESYVSIANAANYTGKPFVNATTTVPTRIAGLDSPALSAYDGPIDEAFVASINPFWLQFDPPSSLAHYTLACIHTTIMTAGLLGNALVIFMFLRFRSLRTPANTLVMNLAVSDFFMLVKAPFVIYNSFQRGPALGDLGCRLYGFFGGLTGTVSITTLTAISIDRYFVVVHPLDPLRNITKMRSRIMVVIVWLYSGFFAAIPALDVGYSRYVPEGFLTSCSFDYLDRSTRARIFMFLFFVFAWLVPFCIITYCYYHILRAVMAAKKIQSTKDTRKRTEIRVAVVVLAIIALWFAAWTPYSIVALLGISGNEALITPLVSMVPAVFCKSAACLDPYVYAITHPRFQMEFRRLCGMSRAAGARTSATRFTSIGRSSTIRSSVRGESMRRGSTQERDGSMRMSRIGISAVSGATGVTRIDGRIVVDCRTGVSTISEEVSVTEMSSS